MKSDWRPGNCRGAIFTLSGIPVGRGRYQTAASVLMHSARLFSRILPQQGKKGHKDAEVDLEDGWRFILLN